MKLRFWTMGLAVFLALGFATSATTYYIDDNANDGDVYTPGFTGNDSNDGLTPTTPKLTLNNLLSSTNLLPGDIVLIDTGTYSNNVVIGAGVNGTVDNRIVFQGSTNRAVFTASGNIITINGKYLSFSNIVAFGVSDASGTGISLDGASWCDFEQIQIDQIYSGIRVVNASNSNSFRRCKVKSKSAPFSTTGSPKGNSIEKSVLYSSAGVGVAAIGGGVTSLLECIVIGAYIFQYETFASDVGAYNIFYPTITCHYLYETLSELQRLNTNWHHNTVADPKFVNAEGLDFHLLSAAGFVSNGVWVTNAAVGYSPGIDFGARE
ncbi:MAG TPA: hypothetical protein PK572_04740 [Kiritimatiellia bacterium]|nr:hypothetical protein [Kiritimatiellia bacterium]